VSLTVASARRPSAARTSRPGAAPGRPMRAPRPRAARARASEEDFIGPHMQQPHMQAFVQTTQTFLDGQADLGFWHETLAT